MQKKLEKHSIENQDELEKRAINTIIYNTDSSTEYIYATPENKRINCSVMIYKYRT